MIKENMNYNHLQSFNLISTYKASLLKDKNISRTYYTKKSFYGII